MTREQPLLNPMSDLVFKAIFGREQVECKEILMDFLNAILGLKGEEKITSLIYQNPFNLQKYEEDKLSILDIKVETNKGEIINIEVQLRNADDFRKRSLYYWSKIYAETINSKEHYETLKKTIIVNLVDFNLLEDTNEYHSEYRLLEKTSHKLLNDDLSIHFLELPKFKMVDNKKEMDESDYWLTFLKDGENEEVLAFLRERSEKIKMAVDMLEKVSADTLMREEYNAREKARLDEISRINYAKSKGKKEGIEQGRKEGKAEGLEQGLEQGIEQGLEQGLEQGKKEMALNLLNMGLTVEDIAEASGLSVEEIRNLK